MKYKLKLVEAEYGFRVQVSTWFKTVSFGLHNSTGDTIQNIGTTFKVSNKPFRTATTVITQCYNYGGIYETVQGNQMEFCTNALERLFGEVPKHIYFKVI